MTVEEGKKLIAEFDGWKIENCPELAPDGCGSWCLRDGTGRNKGMWEPTKTHLLLATKYDESWDWIMPVVIKCYSIVNDGQNPDMEVQLSEALLSCDINELLPKVIQLIQWYNTQKPPQP